MKIRTYYLSISIVIYPILAVLFLSGCTKQSGKPHNISIGVVLKCSSNPFFREIEKGIRETAEQNCIKVAVVSPEQRDPAEQVKILESLINLNVDALLFTPEGKTASIPMIALANRKNIPVILLDTGIDEEQARASGAHYECLITSDNERGGEIAGDYLGEKLGGKGMVLLIPGDVVSYAGERRIKGFRRSMKKYPQIQVMTAPPADFSRAKAFEISKEIFKQHKLITGVFALNDLMALGVTDALETTRTKNVSIIGFDATEMGMKAVMEGRINATITQYPHDMGKIAVESLLKIKRGEKLPSLILTKTELVTTEKLRMPFESK